MGVRVFENARAEEGKGNASGDDGLGSASHEGDTTCGVACDGTRESLNCLPDGKDSGIEAGGKIETPQSTMIAKS